MCKFIKEFFTRDWTLYEKIFAITTVGLLGILLGIFISPLKGGWKLFSENGSHNRKYNGDCLESAEE